MRTITILAAALGLVGCGQAERGALPDRPDTTITQVRDSGNLGRLAVAAGGPTIELPVVRNCAVTGAESGVVAPPCKPVPEPGHLPELGVESGDPMEIITGEGAATVTLIGGSEKEYLDADPLDETRQRWRVRLPASIAQGSRFQISVSPLRTDSGSLGFGFTVNRP